MQQQLDALNLPVGVSILGVNAIGEERSNDAACAGKDIPWLQETTDDPAWSSWRVTYRDVIILDQANVPIGVYNLTDNDLNDPARFDELKALLTAAAGGR